MPELDPLADAVRQIQHTDRPIEEIADDLGITRAALDRRLERSGRPRAAELRTGQPAGPGRPRTGRDQTFSVKVTADERAALEAAITREREAGATTDGEALVRAIARTKPRSKRK